MAEQKQERAQRVAAQQALAEQHHRQVLVRGLWEGLGQAVSLRRIARQDAHRHFQLCRQRQVGLQVCSLQGVSAAEPCTALYPAVTIGMPTEEGQVIDCRVLVKPCSILT